MMRVIVLIFVSVLALNLRASNYSELMRQNVDKMYKATTTEELVSVSAVFFRLSQEDSIQWLPLYYASYSLVRVAFFSKNTDEKNMYLNVAQDYVDKLLRLQPDESEVYVLQALLFSMRINGLASGMKYSVLSNEALDRAEELNAGNPRVFYCRGNNVYHTPVMFGGGKNKAKAHFKKAMMLFENDSTEVAFWPSWGEWHNEQMLKECN